jgi:DNA-binding LacI/PurR family transcriptional regulator
MENKPATILDVARLAGVSKDTASVVLNGSRSNTRVGAATRERVLAAAETLAYRRNAVALGLGQRKMKTIGVLIGAVPLVMSSADNPYAAMVLDGVLREARRQSYNVTLFAWTWEEVREGIASLGDGRNDGFLLIVPPTDDDSVRAIAALGVPVVTVAHPAPERAIQSVLVENAAGIAQAVAYLVELGHTKIAHIAGPLHVYDGLSRRDGFQAALRHFGLDAPPEYLEQGGFGGTLDEEAAHRLLSLPVPPSAIVAANDTSAITVLQVARERGVPVPEQLSVVGFDDIPTASWVTPALTTISQPLRQMGEAAARALFAHLQGLPPDSSVCTLAPSLVVRASTGPA